MHSKDRAFILAPTGPLGRDYDDVRRYADAAETGMKRAIRAGAKSPMLLIQPAPATLVNAGMYNKAIEVSLLSALAGRLG